MRGHQCVQVGDWTVQAILNIPQLQHCHRAQLPVYNQRVLKMLFRWVLCTLLILQSTFSASRTIEEPKVRAFRRAGEVDEFCRGPHGQQLGCNRPGGVVDPEECPLNLTGCPNAYRDVNDSSDLTIDTSGDDLCQCTSDNSNGSLCVGCSPSPKAVTMAAGDLRTAINTIHLYSYYVWGYLRRRAKCVPSEMEAAVKAATEMLAERLKEIAQADIVRRLGKKEVLCGSEIGSYASSGSPVYNFHAQVILNLLHMGWWQRLRDDKPTEISFLGSVCGDSSNDWFTNEPKRQREISNALQHLKGLLEAYSCVTRGIADSDSLCCYISCCEVVPRVKQCLNVLNVTALHSIAEDVLRGTSNIHFLEWIGRAFGASFDCVPQ